MKTYPLKDDTDCVVAIEVDAALCGVANLARTIGAVADVSDVVVRKPFSGSGDVRATFRYRGDEFAVTEPFGDNSRYWIGPVAKNLKRDVSPIERQLASYVPSLFRRVLGGLVTLNFRASAGG